ncbi:MAG: glycine--tRNA ligase subunit beta, partial [Veillonella sp.]|nr:glycine--tRNA ligase subunit beta [Veillonella sp.]
EFTELQGEMGKQYALLDGESTEVAEAIFEQYLPRFAGDILPQTEAGKVLSIIDKVDNIVATFSRGLIPTGSQDPYALRRQTIGILNILLTSGWDIQLTDLFKKAIELLNVPAEKHQELLGQLRQFVVLRLKNIFLDREVPHDVIELVLSNESATVADVEGLIEALMANRIDQNEELVQAYTRMYNLVKEVAFTAVDESLLKEEAEKALYAEAKEAYAKSEDAWNNRDYTAVVALPATLVPAINTFFEDVMVMDKDEAIKANRLQLVRLAYEVMYAIGDVSALK